MGEVKDKPGLDVYDIAAGVLAGGSVFGMTRRGAKQMAKRVAEAEMHDGTLYAKKMAKAARAEQEHARIKRGIKVGAGGIGTAVGSASARDKWKHRNDVPSLKWKRGVKR